MERVLVRLVLVSFFFLPASFSWAATANLRWDTNQDLDLAGYVIYYGTASYNYTTAVNVGLVQNHEIMGLPDGTTYYFSMTAYDTAGNESAFSQEIAFTTPVPSDRSGKLGNPPEPSDSSDDSDIQSDSSGSSGGGCAFVRPNKGGPFDPPTDFLILISPFIARLLYIFMRKVSRVPSGSMIELPG